ncbi:sensor histidine kinase [Solimicrobium silvestre]|uniref:histidine kinase n=1 Tax=Solimicrobium silvestre TaxID=2099400 RepID=A0A2S9H026_9BURK|nr:HAMP domain-containing sensor histidine kinase [Solimicrobium silvestre]PRC93303.1 Histidine kinase-, DNA gyrase B-, and HSP90-like ATPase [Solimicrobium silvestre]
MLATLSFRQLLLAGFLLIAVLLSGTSVQALLTIGHLATQSRTVAHQAVALTAETQRLAERTVAMERSARQYMVLDDPAFRALFLSALQDARASLQLVVQAAPGLPTQPVAKWLQQSALAWDMMQDAPDRAALKKQQQALYSALVNLSEINDQLALASKREIERSNEAALSELEQQRRLLIGLVSGAILLAILLALSFGVWLSRPLAQIEVIIERLGENKFDQSIVIHGPADMRKLGLQLDWLRQRLGNLEDDKSRFLRHISHELKTPLAALREGVALLKDEVVGTLTEPQREIARILSQNSASLQIQIEDLLRYNTAVFDARQVQLSRVNLPELLTSVIQDQRLQWQARSLQITVVPGTVTEIDADAGKLSIVLANLLTNAVRFSPVGGVIQFVLAAKAQAVQIDCIDQGPGIAAEDTKHIFEPFYQGARQMPGARSGNGIGLSIVVEYIAAHDGNVQLLPVSAGAHFRIELPYEH